MRIETYERGKYQIVRVQDRNQNISNLSEIRDLITGYLQRGKHHIAVGFTDASYIYSGAISVLINCLQIVEKNGGTLSIIEPDPGLFDVLETLNIDRVVNIYVSEEYLPY